MKGCLRSFLIFLLVSVAINVLMRLIGSSGSGHRSTTDPTCEEYANENVGGDRAHQRYWWFSEEERSYCLRYSSFERLRAEEEEHRRHLRLPKTNENFWGFIYEQLVNNASEGLDDVADSLMHQAHRLGYGRVNLARMTVSFVQDIPYSYVIPSDCEEQEDKEKPCLGNIPYGIIGPYEFLHTLSGDCDTRSVLLYVLLSKMGFDPMIVVSDEYTHAMLAIHLPAHGDFILYAGKRYYFWETTATGWPVGLLPPDVSNVDYWKIALVE